MLPGQFLKLQYVVSILEPKQIPLFLSTLLFDLLLDLVPDPQVLEHEEKRDHVDQTQFSENYFLNFANLSAEKLFQKVLPGQFQSPNQI